MTEAQLKVQTAEFERFKRILVQDIKLAKVAISQSFYPYSVLEVYGQTAFARIEKGINDKLSELILDIQTLNIEDYK